MSTIKNKMAVCLGIMALLSCKQIMIEAPKPYEPEMQPWQPRKGNGKQNGKRKRNADRWK